MGEADKKSPIVRAAEVNFSAILETRNRLLDESSASSRWMMATLATLNAGGALGIAALSELDKFTRFLSICAFCFGVFCAVMIGYITILAVQSLSSAINDLADEWMTAILVERINLDNIHSRQVALIKKAKPWKIASHVFGWLSLASFFAAIAISGSGLP